MSESKFDFFHWNMLIGFIIVTAVLSAATAQDPQNIRQASMPQAIVLYLASSQLIITGIMAKMGWKTPIRFSSTPRGSVMKPGVFVLAEDIVAVDGAGGQEFREVLSVRYESSETFRRLVAQMNWFWGVGSMIVACGTTAFVYAVEDLNVVFALGRWNPFAPLIYANLKARLVSSVGVGWDWCHLHALVDEEDAEARAKSVECSASIRDFGLLQA
jgi:hypothetical protein